MGKRLRALLAEGKLTRVFMLGQICHPKIVEMLGLEGGWDGIWLDQEHAGLSIAQIEDACRAARAAGLDSFVRIAPTDYATVMRPLEAGAGGIMAAQVRSAAQAQEIVRWAKFHPLGFRGVNGSGIDGHFGALPSREYMAKANAETLVAIQIEHVDAVNDVEKIAALPEVDVLFIGPADLGQSMGIVGEWNHPRIQEAIERVAKACKEHRRHWAILPPTLALAKRYVELGCRMLSIGIDTWTLQRGMRAVRDEFRELGEIP